MGGFSNEILIAEDNCINFMALEGLMTQNFNLKIDSAMNGIEAIQKVKDKYRLLG